MMHAWTHDLLSVEAIKAIKQSIMVDYHLKKDFSCDAMIWPGLNEETDYKPFLIILKIGVTLF